jgi:beta-barrel assembly-enhancing protease
VSSFLIRAFLLVFVSGIAMSGTLASPLEMTVRKSDQAKLADEAQRLLLRRGFVLADTPALSYMNTVMLRIRGIDTSAVPFRILIVKSFDPNAVSYANGLLILCTGALAIVDNETQLAFLLAHEMAHYSLNHQVRERYVMHKKSLELVRQQIASAFFLGGWAMLGAEDTFREMMCGFSRELEKEADRLALKWIIRAGYDPRVALMLFKNLQTRTGKDSLGGPDVLKTHPSISERISLSKTYLGTVKLPAASASAYTYPDAAVFFRSLAKVYFVNAQECLAASEFSLARRSIDVCLRLEPSSPSALAVKAGVFLMRRDAQDLDSAMTFYHKAIASDALFAAAHRDLGYCHLLVGHCDSAAFCFDQYLRLNPAAIDDAFIRFYRRYADEK